MLQKMPLPPTTLRQHMDSVIFQDLIFGNDKNVFFFSLAIVERNFSFIVDIVLPVVSFLLSFLLKSCYLKKKNILLFLCSKFILFSSLLFKMGRRLTAVVLSGNRRNLFKKCGRSLTSHQ